ncbi:MAG: antibiotic biosynthesis monooxygenase family protein [Nitrospinota bacterium]
MYARLAIIPVESGMRSRMQKLDDQVATLYKAQKGFKSVTFLEDDAVDEHGSFSLWETKEDAEAAGAIGVSVLRENASDILKGPPTIRWFEVYEPKA